MSDRKQKQSDASKGGTVSEGGSSLQNADTSQGGADSVPDTPDVNTGVSDAVDVNEHGQQGKSARDDDIPN